MSSSKPEGVSQKCPIGHSPRTPTPQREELSMQMHAAVKSLLFAAAALCALAANAEPTVKPTENDERLIEALQADIPHILRLTRAPGLNLAIARRGGVIWQAGFGYADLERKIPMTADTVTRSGSMGKTYTATAVMQLVERGVLELDAPVNRYLDGWKIVNPLGGREVTVRDLLTHRSGLASNGAWSVFTTPRPLAEHVPAAYAREHNDYYGGVVPTWRSKPGEKYEYSNLGIATLGYLVEVTNPEKLSFSEYVQKHIIDPLGMTSTQFPPVQDEAHVRPDIWKRTSKGYIGLGPLRVPTPPIYFEDYPAGTVVTRPADHVRLLLAMMNGGRYNDYQLLEPETVEQMLTPQVDLKAASEPSLAPTVQVGLVWNLRNWGTPLRSFEHSGAHMWGWTNRFIAFPELDAAIAVFTNHWSLPNDPATRYKEASLIVDFVRSWLERERAGTLKPVPERSWAWKVSYVAGLMTVDAVNGVLGIKDRLSPATIDAMVGGAAPRATGAASVWDPEGYRAGLADLAKAELTPAGIAAFLKSDRLQVLPEELPLIYLELGGPGFLAGVRN
jgi:CubicO group peptidase (beta-lactamase class C family)